LNKVCAREIIPRDIMMPKAVKGAHKASFLQKQLTIFFGFITPPASKLRSGNLELSFSQ
jgi:hypothetical protein